MYVLVAMVFVGMGALPVGGETHFWHDDYGAALAETKILRRPLLITIDDPEQLHVFPTSANSLEAEEALKKFVLCRIDVSKKYGKEVARCFRATEFPFTAIIDASGSHVSHKKVGVWKGPEFVQVLNRTLGIAAPPSPVSSRPLVRRSASSTPQNASDARPVLLDFHASWCGPCKRMHPTVDRLEREGYAVQRVDIDHQPDLARQYGIQTVPTMVLVAGGREVGRVRGVTTLDALKRLFKSAGFEPGKEPAGSSASPSSSANSSASPSSAASSSAGE